MRRGREYHRLGDHYTARFLKRHPEVATTVARATDRNRVLAINKESLKTCFDNLERCISRNKILPENMWNFDEKGFRMGQGEKKNELVIARVRVESPRRAQDGNREWVTTPHPLDQSRLLSHV